jgi:hypothetical protein
MQEFQILHFFLFFFYLSGVPLSQTDTTMVIPLLSKERPLHALFQEKRVTL